MPEAASDASRAARAWDAHAPDYARLFAPPRGHVAPGGGAPAARAPRILDIACGPAIWPSRPRLCADRGAGAVLATDISPAMVARAEGQLGPYRPLCAMRGSRRAGPERGRRRLRRGIPVLRHLPLLRPSRGLARGRLIPPARRVARDLRLTRARRERVRPGADGAADGSAADPVDRPDAAIRLGGDCDGRRPPRRRHGDRPPLGCRDPRGRRHARRADAARANAPPSRASTACSTRQTGSSLAGPIAKSAGAPSAS